VCVYVCVCVCERERGRERERERERECVRDERKKMNKLDFQRKRKLLARKEKNFQARENFSI